MKKRQVDHVLRAAGRITGEKQFIIIGSQSLHGKHPDIADDIVRSAEVDLIAKRVKLPFPRKYAGESERISPGTLPLNRKLPLLHYPANCYFGFLKRYRNWSV
jgi:hypothetical protein